MLHDLENKAVGSQDEIRSFLVNIKGKLLRKSERKEGGRLPRRGKRKKQMLNLKKI